MLRPRQERLWRACAPPVRVGAQGAQGEGIDALFVTGGLAAGETRTTDRPEAEALERFLRDAGCHPTYAIGYLR